MRVQLLSGCTFFKKRRLVLIHVELSEKIGYNIVQNHTERRIKAVKTEEF